MMRRQVEVSVRFTKPKRLLGCTLFAPPVLCKLWGDRSRGYEVVTVKVLSVEDERWFHSGHVEVYIFDDRDGCGLSITHPPRESTVIEGRYRHVATELVSERENADSFRR